MPNTRNMNIAVSLVVSLFASCSLFRADSDSFSINLRASSSDSSLSLRIAAGHQLKSTIRKCVSPLLLLHAFLGQNLLDYIDPVVVFLYQGLRLSNLGAGIV
jgi:hypothetical protein